MNIFRILSFLLFFAIACSAAPVVEGNLQVTVFDDYREAPVAIPIYYTFELKNIGKDLLIIPLDANMDFTIIVEDGNGNLLRKGGSTGTRTLGEHVLKLSPGETQLFSFHLNNKFGFQSLSEGKYYVHLLIESNGLYETGDMVNGQYVPRHAPCWKGTLKTQKIEIKVVSPPTEEDKAIYKLLSLNGPIPDIHSYLQNREALFGDYSETIYAGLALVDGFFYKTEKSPDQYELAKSIINKYPKTPIATILEYHYGGFVPAVQYANKIQAFQKYIMDHPNTAWTEKAKRKILWLQECIKDKDGDKCKYGSPNY